MSNRLIIGTRGSQLALCQSNMVKDRLEESGFGPVELKIITTTGDRIIDKPLPEVGGKGLFTEQLESALLNGEIDLAVHSLKDLPTEMNEGLCLGAVPERESPFDVLVGPYSLKELPEGATVGTSSLRRRAQLLVNRPDLTVIDLRGNLDTRLKKVEGEGGPDAAVLAEAGLNRLGLAKHIAERFPLEVMLPAASQGALGIQCRADDSRTLDILGEINHEVTRAEVEAERAFLDRLQGGCHVPIGCLGRCDNGEIVFTAGIFHCSGTTAVKGEKRGPVKSAREIGIDLAEHLLEQGGREILDECSIPAA